jgi:hypothetical protein
MRARASSRCGFLVVARVVARPDVERVSRHPRRLHRVDSATRGEGGDGAAQGLRRGVPDAGGVARLLERAGEVALRERVPGSRREHEVFVGAVPDLLLFGEMVHEDALQRREEERRVRVGSALARHEPGGSAASSVVDGALAELERPVYFSGSDAPPGAYGLKGTLGP